MKNSYLAMMLILCGCEAPAVNLADTVATTTLTVPELPPDAPCVFLSLEPNAPSFADRMGAGYPTSYLYRIDLNVVTERFVDVATFADGEAYYRFSENQSWPAYHRAIASITTDCQLVITDKDTLAPILTIDSDATITNGQFESGTVYDHTDSTTHTITPTGITLESPAPWLT